MTTGPSRDLTRALAEYAARIPVPVSRRLAAAFAEVTASGAAPGLAVGEQASLFSLPDATGQMVELAARLEQGPLVLSFYRGEWCPFCNLELRAYQQALPKMEALGEVFVAVSPEKPEFAQLVADKQKLTFPVLTDHENLIGRKYGLVYQMNSEVKAIALNFGND